VAKKKGVADAVEDLHRDDQSGGLRKKRINREARRVAEDADDHRPAPAELLERHAQHEHGEQLRHLPDGHHGHDPVPRDAHAAPPQ